MVKFKIPVLKLSREPTSREKIFFLAILAVSLFIFLDVLWQPRATSVKMMKAELKNLDLQTDAVRRLIDATKTQLSKTQDEPKNRPRIDPYVKRILERKVVDFTEEINSTADLMGSRDFAKKAKILKVEMGERMVEGDFVVVPIVVELSGRYTAVREYFKALENIGRPLIVKSFSMKKDAGKSNLLSVSVDTQLIIPKL